MMWLSEIAVTRYFLLTVDSKRPLTEVVMKPRLIYSAGFSAECFGDPT